jgi:hypothetical protein
MGRLPAIEPPRLRGDLAENDAENPVRSRTFRIGLLDDEKSPRGLARIVVGSRGS